MMTPEELEAILERAQRVGVEKWDLPWSYEEGAVLDRHNDIICETLDEEAGDFISHAGADIVALVDEVRRLQKET